MQNSSNPSNKDLKKDINGLQNNVNNLKNGVNTLNKRVTKLEISVEKLNVTSRFLIKKVNHIETQLHQVQEQTKLIPKLYDNVDKIVKETVNNRLQNHETRVSNLESTLTS